MVHEVSDRNIPEEDLPAADDVEEVIVGESGKRAARIVEAEEPRGDEDADRARDEDRVAETRRHGPSQSPVAAIARGALDRTRCARPRLIGVWRVIYHPLGREPRREGLTVLGGQREHDRLELDPTRARASRPPALVRPTARCSDADDAAPEDRSATPPDRGASRTPAV